MVFYVKPAHCVCVLNVMNKCINSYCNLSLTKKINLKIMKAKFNMLPLCLGFLIAVLAFALPVNALAQYNDNYQQNERNYNEGDYDDDNYDDNDNYNDDRRADVDIDVFYNELSPYGTWVNSPTYGRAWVYNEAGFRPYQTGGHWAYSNYGWTWVSNYRWGWAPFHYGRWVSDPYHGWMWVPGYTWGPAWVAWRSGGGYYGWAPLAPSMGVNVGVSFGYGGISANLWMFAPSRYITSPYVGRYCMPARRNTTIIHNTTIINNYNTYNNRRYVSGPSRVEVERNTRQRVNVVQVNNASRPGQTRLNNNRLEMYRPNAIKKNSASVQKNNNDRRQNISGQSNQINRDNLNRNNNGTVNRNQQDVNRNNQYRNNNAQRGNNQNDVRNDPRKTIQPQRNQPNQADRIERDKARIQNDQRFKQQVQRPGVNERQIKERAVQNDPRVRQQMQRPGVNENRIKERAQMQQKELAQNNRREQISRQNVERLNNQRPSVNRSDNRQFNAPMERSQRSTPMVQQRQNNNRENSRKPRS